MRVGPIDRLPPDPSLPLIAIVGRPNVGKSTLYNRLVGGRPALVHDRPGVTRDRRYGGFDYFGRDLRVVDTGGLDLDAETERLEAGIHRQARAAIDEADVVVFVVDGKAGLAPGDHDLASELRRVDKPVLIAVNKVDSAKRDVLAAEFYALGLGDIFAISAAHGRGIDDLLDAVVSLLPPVERAAQDEGDDILFGPADADAGADGQPGETGFGKRGQGPLRVAFIGKPNAGKSSLVNRLTGAERSLVHDQPGTTTDPVDTPFSYRGTDYMLIDTAGMRRKARVDEATEKISALMALGQLERAEVAVLVIDGNQAPSEQDAKIAGAAYERGCGLVIAINKSDAFAPGQPKVVEQKLDDELHFVSHAPTITISALRGDGVAKLMSAVDKVAGECARRVPTAELNRFFEEICLDRPPPTQSGRSVRIHYMTQGGVRPPTFVVWCNRPKYLAASYRKFLVNQLRARYGFRGAPLRLIVKAKARGKPDDGRMRS